MNKDKLASEANFSDRKSSHVLFIRSPTVSSSTCLGWVLFTEQSLQKTELRFEVLVLAVLLCHRSTVLFLTKPVNDRRKAFFFSTVSKQPAAASKTGWWSLCCLTQITLYSVCIIKDRNCILLWRTNMYSTMDVYKYHGCVQFRANVCLFVFFLSSLCWINVTRVHLTVVPLQWFFSLSLWMFVFHRHCLKKCSKFIKRQK